MSGWWIFGGVCIVFMIIGLIITEQIRKHFKAASRLTNAAMEAGYFPSLIANFFRNPFTGFIIIPSFIIAGLMLFLAMLITGMTPLEVFKEITRGKETAANNFMTLIKNPEIKEHMVSKEDIEEFGAYFDFDRQDIEELYLQVRSFYRERSNES